MSEKQFYRPAEIATIMGVTKATVRRWIKEGEIEAVKMKNRYYIDRSVLCEFSNNSNNNSST